MGFLTKEEHEQTTPESGGRVLLQMMWQIADGLEEEAESLNRRAKNLEEEDFLISREIAEHQTEINRLRLKLDSLNADRDGLLEKIEELRREASTIRQNAMNDEEELALGSLESSNSGAIMAPSAYASRFQSDFESDRDECQRPVGTYFRRMSLTDVIS